MKKLLICAVLALSACATSDLNADWLKADEATRKAVMADVKAGLYKPDANSTATLKGWAEVNAKAIEVLKKEKKWGGE